MAVFTYKAFNSRGRQVKGVIDAESARAARQKLKAQGIFPTDLQESARTDVARSEAQGYSLRRTRRIGAGHLAVITRQLATLVAAGMPLVESLKALGEQIDQPTVREVIAEVRDKVNEGSTLAASMREYPAVFPKLYVNMVASGEASGSLDAVLSRLADLLEAQAELQRKVISALTYPILMLVLCFGVILLLLAYVVPQITSIFENQGAVLPLPTRIVIGLSEFVQGYWLLLVAAIIGGAIGLRSYSKTERGRKGIDGFLLRLPVLGNLRLKIATSRFARNLGMMLTSGIELLTALAIVKNIIGNVLLEEAVESAIEGVREGSSLAGELNKSELFPRLLIHMTAIGERTGQLENMLLRAANAFESEVDSVIAGFTSILEPVLIIVLALVVGAILASVMLPMLEMTSLAR
ncbi:MAG: type II secretion system inner membrane protein GspF [Bdellovibrionales bacterium]|nr:type II secretion system inner membrane protein GspF [Bdellovibrionales bacterium]